MRANIGDLEQAFTDFSAAIKSDEKCPDAYCKRSMVYNSLGLFKRSKDDAQKALALWTSSPVPERLLDHAGILENVNNSAASSKEYELVLSLLHDPKSINNLYLAACAHAGLHQYKDTIDCLNKAIKSGGDNSLLLLRSAAYGKSKSWQLALEDIDRYLEANPQHPVGLNIRGYILFNQGKLREAFTNYDYAILLEPNFPYALHWRGRINHERGAYRDAIKDYTSAIALDDTDFASLAERAHCYWHLQQWATAIKDAQQSISINPKFMTAYRYLAESQIGAGDNAKAIEAYSKAISIEPQNASLYFNRGMYYRGQAQYKEAIADLAQAEKYNPSDPIAYCARGSALLSDHQYERAIEDCNQSLKLDPKRAHPYLTRGISYSRLGNYKLALKDLDQVLKMAWNYYGEAYYERSQIHKILGNERQAAADLKESKMLKRASAEAM